MARVEIFSGPHCRYCEQAKDLLARHGIPYDEYRISEREHMLELGSRLPRAKSVPQIFIDGEHIGNDQDLQVMDSDGRLAALRTSDT